MSNYDFDYYEFRDRVRETTQNLKKLSEAQENMRWQFGDPHWWNDFVKEVQRAHDGWMSSHC